MTKLVPLVCLVLATCITPARSAPPPVVLGDGIVLEAAWAKLAENGDAEIFLVVNNRNLTGSAPLQVGVVGAASTDVVDASGQSIEPLVPSHAELYMLPGGVRVVATGLLDGPNVSLRVTLGDKTPVAVDAVVLPPDQPVPDHHDFDHG